MTNTVRSAQRATKTIDLGAARVETRGGVRDPIYDNPQSSMKNQFGLTAD